MRRRKTDPDVAPELPEKVSDRYVELTREQAALYEAATADTLARLGHLRCHVFDVSPECDGG